MSDSARAPIYGPGPWSTRDKAVWSYWDLWFCVVALADHDGDLDALAEAIENGGRWSASGTVEAKLSHLDDLERRMAEAGIDARELAAGEVRRYGLEGADHDSRTTTLPNVLHRLAAPRAVANRASSWLAANVMLRRTRAP